MIRVLTLEMRPFAACTELLFDSISTSTAVSSATLCPP